MWSDMAEIDDRIAVYLQALEIEGKSPRTIASYANSLRDFRRAGSELGLPSRPADYCVEHVYAFLSSLQKRGASPAFQHRRHREVKACFSWLKRVGYVEENVFARVPLVRCPQRIQLPFKRDEVQALLTTQDPQILTGCRNYALILFLLDTGVRASECIGVKLGDVDWSSSRVRIRHVKGDKERWVGIGDRTGIALRDYIERFRSWAPGHLFLTSKGPAMADAHTLNVILHRLERKAGVRGVHPHRFRHTFATWAIESGAREIDVQLLLGHSDLTMTHRYARTYISEQALRAHAELSPVRRLGAG